MTTIHIDELSELEVLEIGALGWDRFALDPILFGDDDHILYTPADQLRDDKEYYHASDRVARSMTYDPMASGLSEGSRMMRMPSLGN